MSDHRKEIVKVAVAQLCQSIGWNSIETTPLQMLSDMLVKYMKDIATNSHRYSELGGRTEPNLDDVALAFKDMNVNIADLEEYVNNVDPVPCDEEDRNTRPTGADTRKLTRVKMTTSGSILSDREGKLPEAIAVPEIENPLTSSDEQDRSLNVRDSDGNEVSICPVCGRVDDGTPMVGCETCDARYHWACVGIQVTPDANEWYCRGCVTNEQEREGCEKQKKRTKKH